MSDGRKSKEMVVTKRRNKVLSCSTPNRMVDSPSRDSDSEGASPVPFICTQDGGEGVADVVWNYYGTSSKNGEPKSSTPINKKSRKRHRLKMPEKEQTPTILKRKAIRPTQKKTQLPIELLELNQFVDQLMEKKAASLVGKPQSGSEEDIFSDTSCSPKSTFRNKRCLRKNVLSSKFTKPESENGLESDDSINECLFKVSQAVEDILNHDSIKEPCAAPKINPGLEPEINEDSMDAILKSINSPFINKLKCASPGLKNDSFDSLVGNLNDSALERLSQMPVAKGHSTKMDRSKAQASNWTIKELIANDASPSSRFSFTRHSSMPESPTITDPVKHTSAMPLGRYSSMPSNDNTDKVTGDSPIRCTPIEIQKKHQQAREKLLAKRLLPFTQTQQPSSSFPSHTITQTNDNKHVTDRTQAPKMFKFQPKVPTSPSNKSENSTLKQNTNPSMDIRSLIERKRQEALMKLRRRHLQK